MHGAVNIPPSSNGLKTSCCQGKMPSGPDGCFFVLEHSINMLFIVVLYVAVRLKTLVECKNDNSQFE